ncbi:MAG TPA: hypothetical protein VGP93_10360, partial [Polyangiaceae bacterium]|nr:hypothetical protein [Polyangiaceae bacterium]
MADLLELGAALRATITAGQAWDAIPFYALAIESSDSERTRAVTAMLDGVATLSPWAVAHLSLVSGTLVEMGADPRVGFDELARVLARGVSLLSAACGELEGRGVTLDGDEQDRLKALPPDVQAWAGSFSLHVIGAMARLARDVANRKHLQNDAEFRAGVKTLRERLGSNHAYFLLEIVDMLDDEPLWLVDLVAGRVQRLRAVAVRSGFHLITLLDGVDPHALDPAPDSLSAVHGYFDFRALERLSVGTPTSLADFGASHLGNSLWGEMRARDLPEFDGQRVVVRAPPVLGGRSWSFSFVSPLHDALRESLDALETLSPEAALSLVTR